MNFFFRLTSLQRRLLVSSLIGLGACCLTFLLQGLDNGFIDIWLAHGSAREWLAGHNPYGFPTGGWPSNPLPAIILMVPLAPFPLSIAAPIFMGVSAGLLAFGLTRDDTWWRLWTFTSFPFIFSIIVVQWSPLILATLLLPALYPLFLVKPHLGAVTAILNFSWKRVFITIIFFAATFLLLPDWIWQWYQQIGGYDGFFPILILPGPILLISLLHWKIPQGKFLFLFSLLPQRLWYDQLLLWWIPRSKRSLLLLNISSWAIGIVYILWRTNLIATALRPSSKEAVIWSLFIPALIIIYLDRLERKELPSVFLNKKPFSIRKY